MSDDSMLLQRYLDGDLSSPEAEQLRARLVHDAALNRQLGELRRVGGLLRLWAEDAERRGAGLIEPTLRRVHEAERQRARHTTLGFALAAALALALPFASQAHLSRTAGAPTPAGDVFAPRAARLHAQTVAPGAAIERIEAADKHARVFVVGTSTPVVWLSDEAGDEAPVEQDPG